MDFYKKVRNEHVAKLNCYLLIFIMTDYAFTYLGINYLGVITEANPLLVSLFTLPFGVSFFIRLIHASLIVTISIFLYVKKYRHYDKFIAFALGLNIFVTFLHMRWVIPTLRAMF
jgi:hypothetical protein